MILLYIYRKVSSEPSLSGSNHASCLSLSWQERCSSPQNFCGSALNLLKQVHVLSLGLAEIQEVHMGPLLKPVKAWSTAHHPKGQKSMLQGG